MRLPSLSPNGCSPQRIRRRDLGEPHLPDTEVAQIMSTMLHRESMPLQPLWKKQLLASAAVALLLLIIVSALYTQNRHREWALRREQAESRLYLAFELITREVRRVRADALYLANRRDLREFVSGSTSTREDLAADFLELVRQKELYDQIRVLDMSGREALRVNFAESSAAVVNESDLQDKSDRYYFQESKNLRAGAIFVSDFDLNQEHGAIEQPLKPVIRFVAPIADLQNQVAGLLVVNYLGDALLKELDTRTIPGATLLLRNDGHYIRGIHEKDAWGWLLGHDRTFATQFPEMWRRLGESNEFQLSAAGAFSSLVIPLGIVAGDGDRPILESDTPQPAPQDAIRVVSYLPRTQVFATSNGLLQRLMVLSMGVFALTLILIRAWARATHARRQQAVLIAESEERLRELSSRLLRIQEEERRSISREIHDELGQQVTAINLDLKLAQRQLSDRTVGDNRSADASAAPDAVAEHLARAIGENETLLQTLHEFARRVRPAVLDDLGLRDAMESHVMEFRTRTQVETELCFDCDPNQLPTVIADNVFRLVQESLNNVAKHAKATHVEVLLSTSQNQLDKDSELLVMIRDNGCGKIDEGQPNRLGLIGMRERVDLLHGSFHVDSEVGTGTSIIIKLPLSESHKESSPCR